MGNFQYISLEWTDAGTEEGISHSNLRILSAVVGVLVTSPRH